MKLLITLLYLVTLVAKGHGFLTQLLGLAGETAPYEVVDTYEGFEKRVYPAQKWVSTTMEGSAYDPLTSSMFMKLFNYISGENDKKISIPMTTPVSTLVQPTSSGNRYTMAFYVPSAHQADVPSGGPDVTVESRPQQTIFTRRFGGWATDATVASERKTLEGLIRTAGLGAQVDFSTYYVAGYDPPFMPFFRRNEVWFVQK